MRPGRLKDPTGGAGTALILAILAAAAALRIWGIGREGLWVDEAYTSIITLGSFRQIFEALAMDDAPPLYYLLQKPLLGLLGRSESALRLLSALSGTAIVAALFVAGNAVGRRVGWTAAILSAASVVAIFHSRQARSYALVQLLATLLLGCTLHLRREPGAGKAALFWALSMGLIYSHNLGVLVIAAGWLVIAAPLLRTEHARRVGLGLAAATALGAIPWLMSLQTQSSIHAELNEWMAAWWDQGRPMPLAPLMSWGVFLNGAAAWLSPPIHLAGLDGAWRALLWPILAMAAWGTASAILSLFRGSRRTGRDPSDERSGILCAVSFSLIPTVGLLLISALLAPAYVLGRTDSLALPGFILLLAIGWSRIRPSWAGHAAGALWVAAGIISLTAFAPAPKGSDRALAHAIDRSIGPRDALVFSGLTRPTVEHYARRDGWWDRLGWAGSFPEILDDNPAGTAMIPIDSAPALMEQALELRGTWEREQIEAVWILAIRSEEAGDPASVRLRAGWPGVPQEPDPARVSIPAAEIAYPANLVVASLAGLKPVPVQYEYRQDWVSGLRIVLRIPAESWVPADSVPAIEVRR